MYTLATLNDLRDHLGFAAADTADDARLLALLEAASTQLEASTRRHFSPRLASIAHDIDLRNAAEIILREDLQQLSSVTDATGDIALSRITQLRGAVLRLNDGSAFSYEDTPLAAVTVSGIWGYHPDWTNAFLTSGDTVQNSPLSNTATSLSVNDVTGGGLRPRFQAGQLLRIGAEYLRVLATNSGSNTLTVRRGVRGTSAAEHASGTAIDIYQVPADVTLLCVRWAAWLYREPDMSANPAPPLLLNMLDGLRRISI